MNYLHTCLLEALKILVIALSSHGVNWKLIAV
jgi:hypothetical protein